MSAHTKGKCGVKKKKKNSASGGRGWIFEASEECGGEGPRYRQSNTKCIVEEQLHDVI